MFKNRAQVNSFKISAIPIQNMKLNSTAARDRSTADALRVRQNGNILSRNCSPMERIKQMNSIKQAMYKKFIQRKCIKKIALK